MKLPGKWMELENKNIPSEVSQTQKQKHAYIHLYIDISCNIKDINSTIQRPREAKQHLGGLKV